MTNDPVQKEILAANNRFYTALARADLAAMINLWHHSLETECIHPGWDRLRGWSDIQKSWIMIFCGAPQNVCPKGAELEFLTAAIMKNEML